MPVDWSAAPNALQPYQVGQQSAAFGLEQGQKQASINALQGVNLDDPASVDAGIRASIRAANLEQASALLGLNAKRAVFSGLPSFLASFGSSGSEGQPAAAAPNALASAPAPDAGASPVGPEQIAQHRQIMTEARGAVTQLQNTPAAQRAQVAEGIKQQFLNHGVPEPAVDSALSDLSDEGLAKTGQYYDGVLAASAPPQAADQGAPGGVAQPEVPGAPAMPPHPNGFSWASNLLQDPQKLALLNYYKAAGIDLTGVIDAAEKVAGPQIQAQADIAKAGPIAEAGKAAELKYAPALAGVDVAKQGALKSQEAQYAGAIAAATAAGTAAGQAPGKIQEINLPGGGSLQGTFTPGADGTYVFHPVKAEGGAGGNAGSGGGGGSPGQSQTPGQKAQQEHLAAQAAEFLKPDEKATTTANSSIAAAQRLLSLSDQISLNPATEFAGKVANVGRAVGWPGADKYATDVAAMESALKQGNLEALHQAFPARITNSDLQFGSHAYGGLSTPNDQVRFIAGMQLAAAQRQLDYENFKANYNGPKDNPQQIQQAWLRGEGGQSLFTMPTWTSVKLGGRPAFNPATDIKTVTENGHTERVARFGGNGSAPIYITLH